MAICGLDITPLTNEIAAQERIIFFWSGSSAFDWESALANSNTLK